MAKKLLNTLKTAMGTVAFFLIFSTSLYAQEKADGGAAQVTSYLKSKLSLNDGQYSRVLEINKVYLNKVAENDGATSVEKAKKLKIYNEERDSKLKSVLNASQYKIYIANRSANAKKYKEAVSKGE